MPKLLTLILIFFVGAWPCSEELVTYTKEHGLFWLWKTGESGTSKLHIRITKAEHNVLDTLIPIVKLPSQKPQLGGDLCAIGKPFKTNCQDNCSTQVFTTYHEFEILFHQFQVNHLNLDLAWWTHHKKCDCVEEIKEGEWNLDLNLGITKHYKKKWKTSKIELWVIDT